MSQLTDRQFEVLKMAVTLYDEAVRKEEARWGIKSAQDIAAKGISASEIKLKLDAQGIARTLNSLVDLGLLKIAGTSEARGEALRKGAWGWRTGGTKKWTDIEVWYAPTDAGRAHAEGRWIRWDAWRIESWTGSLPEHVRSGTIVKNNLPILIRLSRAEEGSLAWHESIWIGGKPAVQPQLAHHESKVDAKNDLVERAEHLVEISD